MQGAGWAPEPVRTLWSRDKSFTDAGNLTPVVLSVVWHYTDWAIPTHTEGTRLKTSLFWKPLRTFRITVVLYFISRSEF
jgi:hypothetical protein